MNIVNRFLIFCTILSGIILSASCDTSKDGEHKISICATTDVHGNYFDKHYNDDGSNNYSMSNVSSFVKQKRASEDEFVLLDIGDNIQGTEASFYYNYIDTTSEHVCRKIVKYLKYDALVVGNHDIEAGHSNYDKFRTDKNINYLAANTFCTGGNNKGKPYFQSYAILKRDGVKLAVIGMTNANIKQWISSDSYSGYNVMPVDEVAQSIVDKVIAEEKPDFVILCIHGGHGKGIKSDIENPLLYIARNIKNVDVIFYGHDHKANVETITNPNGNILVLNAGRKAENVAECTIQYKIEKGKVVSKSTFGRLNSMKDYPVDSVYDKVFSNDYNKVRDYSNKIIGTLTEDIHMGDAVWGPSSCLNFISNVLLDVSGADISMIAPNGSNSILKKGDLRVKDLFSWYPYENQLFVIKMTGEQIENYLEYSYDGWINRTNYSFNYDSAFGLKCMSTNRLVREWLSSPWRMDPSFLLQIPILLQLLLTERLAGVIYLKRVPVLIPPIRIHIQLRNMLI